LESQSQCLQRSSVTILGLLNQRGIRSIVVGDLVERVEQARILDPDK
jgi:hypothetical protein